MKYYTGHIDKFWKDDFKLFKYIKQQISEEEQNIWFSQGYDYVKSFSGSQYDSRNVLPEWIDKFKSIFPLKNQTYTFYKMSTLEIMPPHSDHFNTYIKLFGANYENVCRVVVMLEDWKSGHYLEIDNKAFVNWTAGDYILWKSDCVHAASNIGTEDRYTLQITGELHGTNIL